MKQHVIGNRDIGWLLFMDGVFKKGSGKDHGGRSAGAAFWFLFGYSGERMKIMGIFVLVDSVLVFSWN